MTDDDQELPTTDLPAIAPDTFASVLVLLSTLTDVRACGDRLRSLQERQAAAARATAEFAAAKETFDLHCATERAAIAAEREKLAKESAAAQDRHDRVLSVLGDIETRERRIYELEQLWRFADEDADVRRGFREPALGTALEKARRAFGLESPLEGDVPDGRRELAREIDGVPFPPNTTITRDIAVRVRPSRSQRVRADL